MTYRPPPRPAISSQYSPQPGPQRQAPGGFGLPPAARPGGIALIRSLLRIAMCLCIVGDIAALYQLSREITTIGVLVAAATTYFALQGLIALSPLGRGTRGAWYWTLFTALLGLASGVPVIATGIAMLATQPLVITAGLVWTTLYATILSALISLPVRAWIFK